MTDSDAAASAPGTATLPSWLAARSDGELTELLRLRPDLAVPPPSTMNVLANRTEQRASVLRAADELNALEFGVVEALALEQAGTTPVPRHRLAEVLSGRTPRPALDKALDRLRALALVWGTDDGLRIVRPAVDAVPWRIGRATEPSSPMSAADIDEALAELDPGARGLLETLAHTSPLGRTRDAAPGTPADRPVQRLLAAGLLRWVDEETVELPRAVGQVLRGEAVFDLSSLTTPTPSSRKHKPTAVNAAAAGEALELIRHCEDLITALGATPAPALKSGGLGVRELRRVARTTRIDENRVSLLVELLSAAGLIASGFPDPAPPTDGEDYWAPTDAADGWLRAPAARRWAALAGAWLPLTRQPWIIGSRDQNDKPIAALSEEVRSMAAPRVRRLVLELLADLGSGRSVSPAEASAMLTWRRPRWAGRLGVEAVEKTLAEATALGVVAHGALSSPGKALLHGGEAETEMDATLPDLIDYVLVQADLTVVAPGPLIPELLEQIALVADIESAGAATVYRISEPSVRRALDAGMTAAELQALFAARSRTPVPQSLTYLIDDVARRHGRLRAGVASSFVRCEDPALLAEVLASAVAGPLVLRALAPTVAISQAPLGEVLTQLRSAGFAPAGEDSSGTIIDLRPRGARVHARRPAPRHRTPAVPSEDQLASLVRALRAGERAAVTHAGDPVRADGTLASSAATMTLLQLAAHGRRSVRLGYVDAQGIAIHRIVDPVSVESGQLNAFDPAIGTVRQFTLHRITSVALID